MKASKHLGSNAGNSRLGGRGYCCHALLRKGNNLSSPSANVRYAIAREFRSSAFAAAPVTSSSSELGKSLSPPAFNARWHFSTLGYVTTMLLGDATKSGLMQRVGNLSLASKILLQGSHNFRSCWSRKPGTTSEPAILALSASFFHLIANLETGNHRNRTMGTDGSGAGGALDPHDCEAAHYVVTNHRPGSVHLTARCSFLGPDTQVRKVGGYHRQLHLLAANKCGEGISSFWLAIELRLICSDV